MFSLSFDICIICQYLSTFFEHYSDGDDDVDDDDDDDDYMHFLKSPLCKEHTCIMLKYLQNLYY